MLKPYRRDEKRALSPHSQTMHRRRDGPGPDFGPRRPRPDPITISSAYPKVAFTPRRQIVIIYLLKLLFLVVKLPSL